MRIYPHFVVVGFSNSYLIADEKTGAAVIVDPGMFDVSFLKLIEDHHYYIRAVLVTHAHESHINGLKTLTRIYDTLIYSFRDKIFDITTKTIKDGDIITVENLCFEVIETPGHSRDSVVYKCQDYLFTGDTLTAGLIGTTPHDHARKILEGSIQKKIFSLPDYMVIFPGHGPPTRLECERTTNPMLSIET
ncbi:MAG: MBL fold metallo-hydrolase [Spirochaetaceae bacterium]|nr:MAG: MBL fold metallo-hydrolase [Spirochaetaceae bacterium]